MTQHLTLIQCRPSAFRLNSTLLALPRHNSTRPCPPLSALQVALSHWMPRHTSSLVGSHPSSTPITTPNLSSSRKPGRSSTLTPGVLRALATSSSVQSEVGGRQEGRRRERGESQGVRGDWAWPGGLRGRERGENNGGGRQGLIRAQWTHIPSLRGTAAIVPSGQGTQEPLGESE